ncbi:glycosyl transferase family 90 [Labilibacter marinus]|uniref:glycosyl transferase family 90 n=1 Tax=Labilibacter marinus TaxID=1477105 RepID=UPI0009F90272|nr:glycosyl transferase family 90 [Labilibacter marinus]
MTILFINSIGKNKWGGGEKWIVNTAAGLQDMGHKVIIGSRKKSILQKKSVAKNIDTINIKHSNDFSIFSAFKLVKYINDNNIQIIVASLNRDVRICGFSSLISKHKPKVIGRQGVQLISNKWKYRFSFKNLSHGILTNSKSIKKIYDSYGWWNDSFVKVIYNGIAPNETTNNTFDLSTIPSIKTTDKIVVSAGRLDKQKGFKYLIEAAKIARDEQDNIKFIIAGTGKQLNYLTKLIVDYKLQEHVFLVGFVENIQGLLKNADVFVLTSLYEGMPNVLLEAMLQNIPVVTTPVNGASELIEENKSGLFVPIKDPKAIYSKIKQVIDSPEETKAIVKNAKQVVTENFSLEKSVERVNQYFLDVLKADHELYFLGDHPKIRKIRSEYNTFRHKNFKPGYYLKNYLKVKYLPQFSKMKASSMIKHLNRFDNDYINSRIEYYNKINTPTSLHTDSIELKDFIYTGEEKTYYFDTWKYTRHFNPNNKFAFEFGDVTKIPNVPSIVKSRPINGKNQNSVLLNLNRIRHFIFVNDKKSFLSKKNKLVWRGNIWTYQPQRIDFLEKHFNNPMCNVGHVNKADINTVWKTDKLSIDEQLQYKFILSIEGNDVATNLKWIMSSNSLAVMPTPKYETWFMEGKLKPDYHYIHIKDDYSDLNEKLEYYITHPEEADQIRLNANKYVNQFKDKKREKLISLLVLDKYFENIN